MTFSTRTSDAQGVRWCPKAAPLLVVWDSPTYGFRVIFFTPLGHHLRLLDFSGPEMRQSLPSSLDETLGVIKLNWTHQGGKSIITIVVGPREVFVLEYALNSNVRVLFLSTHVMTDGLSPDTSPPVAANPF